MSDKKVARERLGIKDSDMVVLCFGGSLGSPRINELMIKMIEVFNGVEGISIFFVTGKIHFKNIESKLAESLGELKDNIRLFEYIENMPEYMGASDVIISRAGALTVAELTACGKPAILIPSPYVTGNHQYFNARVMSDKGAAVLIEEKDLDDDSVIGVISQMRTNSDILKNMEKNSRSLAKTDAAEKIYNELKELLK